MDGRLIKGMLGGGAARCTPPHDSVAWACFMLGERVDTGRDLLVQAGNEDAVA